MKQTKKLKILKIVISVLVIALFVGLIIYLVPIMAKLNTTEGQIAFKKQVQELGALGLLSLLGLQIAQILLVILPGEPLEILAGMCYGTIGGTIFILVSSFITTVLIYFLVKKFGRKYVYQFFKKERIDKIENSKLFKHPKTVEIILLLLFMIPGTPKDLLVYIGGLLPVNSIRFILIATFGRLPSVISSTIAGSYISAGDWKMTIIVYAITFIITGIVILKCRIGDVSFEDINGALGEHRKSKNMK